MRNVVIITAKGGNQTVPNKNIVPILGVPIILYPVRAAQMSALTDGVFISTEDAAIKKMAQKEGVEIIARPPELATPDSIHADVIEHAVHEVEERHPEVQNVTVLLGNTVMTPPALIDHGFRTLEDGDTDSCMSVWKAQDDHPYRAMRLNADGYAEPLLDVDCSSNRQSYPPVYFYDQGIWAFRKECAYRRQGPVPWVWLGTKCKMIERLWVTGRDIHSWIDIAASAWYLTDIQVNDYMEYSELS